MDGNPSIDLSEIEQIVKEKTVSLYIFLKYEIFQKKTFLFSFIITITKTLRNNTKLNQSSLNHRWIILIAKVMVEI